MRGYEDRCGACKTKFIIPENSTDSASSEEDGEERTVTWVTEDIKCPNCDTIVYKRLDDINADSSDLVRY